MNKMPQEILREMEELVQTPTLNVRLMHISKQLNPPKVYIELFHLYSKNNSIELSKDKMKNFPVSSFEQLEALLDMDDDFKLNSVGVDGLMDYNDEYQFQIWNGEDPSKSSTTSYYGFEFEEMNDDDNNIYDNKKAIEAYKKVMRHITKRAWNIVNTRK